MLRSSDRKAVTGGKGRVEDGGERIAERYEGRNEKTVLIMGAAF
jgi:hypothetical protein